MIGGVKYQGSSKNSNKVSGTTYFTLTVAVTRAYTKYCSAVYFGKTVMLSRHFVGVLSGSDW